MALALYVDYLSQPCRALTIFCKLNGIKYEEKLIELTKGEAKSEAYLKISPGGRVPVMREGDWVLTETMAMLKYLSSQHKVPDNMYPKDARSRARVDEFLDWQHSGIRASNVGVFVNVVFRAKLQGKPLDVPVLKEKVAAFEKALNEMENYFLKDRKYLAGDAISVADIVGICEVMQPVTISYDVCKNRPRLAAWMERVKKDLAPFFYEAHQKVIDFAAPFKTDFDKELA